MYVLEFHLLSWSLFLSMGAQEGNQEILHLMGKK